jgi:hypothetical protein
MEDYSRFRQNTAIKDYIILVQVHCYVNIQDFMRICFNSFKNVSHRYDNQIYKAISISAQFKHAGNHEEQLIGPPA